MQDLTPISFNSLTKVAEGFFAKVYRVPESNLVIKIPNQDAQPLHSIERRVYQRIGRHPNILQFEGERQVEYNELTPGTPTSDPSGHPGFGLCFNFQPEGTLHELLLTDNDSRDSKFMESLKKNGPLLLAKALSHIHHRHIIHGDIGTHNILICKDQLLLLCDFGGSRIDSSKCLAFPSARYRRLGLAQPIEAREQYDPGPKDDIFALGTVMYELHTGRNMWRGLTHGEVLARISGKKWPTGVTASGGTGENGSSGGDDVNLGMAQVIENCWNGVYDYVDEVVAALT